MTIGLGLANVPILRLMNYSDEIMPDVKAYMGIIYAGLVVTAAYNALAASADWVIPSRRCIF